MQIGMIGLGRMGASMVRRLMHRGHSCVVHDVRTDAIAPLVADGAKGTASLDEFAAKCSTTTGARSIFNVYPGWRATRHFRYGVRQLGD